MIKTIYSGNEMNTYSYSHFRDFMLGLGAEMLRPSEIKGNCDVYNFDGITIVRTYTGAKQVGFINSYGHCEIKLLGDKSKIGKVEQIILAEAERFSTPQGIHLGLQN